MATLIERNPTTKRAALTKEARDRSLNRLRGKVARRSAKASWWNGVRQCFHCGQEIVDPSQAAMYRAPIDAPVGTVFVLSDNSRAVVGHRSCPTPPALTTPNIQPWTETKNCWPCRDCDATVSEGVNACLFCGYERQPCTNCRGTGIIDSGPHPVGCDEPCGCENGFYYPTVERALVEDPNDCAGCGDRPAVRDEEGNFTYPRYTHAGKPPVGVCGWCEREGIRV